MRNSLARASGQILIYVGTCITSSEPELLHMVLFIAGKEKVLIDCYDRTRVEIHDHIKQVLGKTK